MKYQHDNMKTLILYKVHDNNNIVFIIRYDRGGEKMALEQIVEWAQNYTTGFDWQDASEMAECLRQQMSDL